MYFALIAISFFFGVLFFFKRNKLTFLLSEFFILLSMYVLILNDLDYEIKLSIIWGGIFLAFFLYTKKTIVICSSCLSVNRLSQKKCSHCGKYFR
ncbi:hypothetical protein DU977_18960 [Vibrio cholerae]|nr:hypothetical protein [Vibrio cholerae]